MSATERDPPGWPDPAAAIDFTIPNLIRWAIRCNSLVSSFVNYLTP